MNLHNMNANELIQHTLLLGSTTTLMDALVNKLSEVTSDLAKAQELLEKVTTIIDGAVDK